MGMGSLTRIKMLIKAGAVKARQTKGVLRKMGRNPVQNHADPLSVQVIHEIHEVLRRAIAGRRRIIARYLIAPGFIQRMLHNGHQLHMRIAHFFYVSGQHRSQLPVCIKLPTVLFLRVRLPPASQMHLIDQHGLLFVIFAFPLLQPFFIGPGKIAEIRDHRSCIRPQFCRVGVRIGLQHGQTLTGLDLIFIAGSGLQSRDKQLEDPCLWNPAHGMTPSVPQIEVANHADAFRIGGPYGKVSTVHTVYGHGMGSHFLINGIVNALFKGFQILFSEYLRMEPVAVLQLLSVPIVIFHQKGISRNRLSRNQCRVKAALIRLLHGVLRGTIRSMYLYGHCCGCGLKRLRMLPLTLCGPRISWGLSSSE